MAGVLKKTTGLLGLAVSEAPHDRLRILYTKILATLQNIPRDAAYRIYTEKIVNERFDLVKTEHDVQKLENKINCGQIEEVILQGIQPSRRAKAVMPSELRAETAQLMSDYLQHHRGSQALPPNQIAKTLWRVADELESHEKMLFHSICNPAALPKPGKVAAHLSRVAAQMEVDSDLNWGRVVALVVFTGNLADVLAEWGAHAEIDTLAEALVTYLAGGKRTWLEAQGGWEGLCCFFNKRGPDVTDQNRTIRNIIIVAAGFGLAGLAFLLAVR
ncbi:UNVERIFIED_CONTAM: hypothetical protein K2H54_061428 [Gekko kuhli]